MGLPADLASITKSDHMFTDTVLNASYVTDWGPVGLPQTRSSCSDGAGSAGSPCSEKRKFR